IGGTGRPRPGGGGGEVGMMRSSPLPTTRSAIGVSRPQTFPGPQSCKAFYWCALMRRCGPPPHCDLPPWRETTAHFCFRSIDRTGRPDLCIVTRRGVNLRKPWAVRRAVGITCAVMLGLLPGHAPALVNPVTLIQHQVIKPNML